MKDAVAVQQERGTATSGNDTPSDYLTARARRETAQADMAEMEAAELRGELVRADEIEAHWGALVVAFRARMMLVAPSVAPLIAAPGKVAEVQAKIQEAVFEALNELSGHAKQTKPH